METTQVSCNGCGAALQVPEGARFVTCRYCNASLEIKRTESAVYTETLQRIDQRTAEMAEDLNVIRHEHEVERLDREWAERSVGLMSRSKDGTSTPPSMVGSIIVMVIMGGFGLIWTVIAFGITGAGRAMGAPAAVSVFPLFGVLFVILAIVLGLVGITKARRFQQEQQEYQRQRGEMLSRGDDART